jgi:hypothetical protein
MKNFFLLVFILTSHAYSQQNALPKFISLKKEQLKNKIMGGWAGQTIGVTFGGPYEFRFQGTFIGDYQPLLWYDGYLKNTMINNPGLYDDLYRISHLLTCLKNMDWMPRLIHSLMLLRTQVTRYGMQTRRDGIIFLMALKLR